jgi:16S rRNA (adenine1518-N6/adenine1519-N6)-dimethyltransferase
MQTLAQIRALLEERGLAPRKSLGQNFLIDQNLIRKLVDTSGVGAGELVLEVGPGTGTLTEELLERGCEVVASELDRGLAELLRERLGPNTRFTLVEGDCLASKRELAPEIVQRLGGRPFTLVANLPYGAATPLTTVLLTQFPKCRGLFVTVQREVADRLLAGPGSKDYGLVSVLAQALGEVKRIAVLPPECFWPRPEVTSSMVAITRRERPLTDDPGRLAEVCQRAFATRRKQLASILGRDVPWPPGVSGTMRAEELPVEKLVELSRVVGPE